LPKITNPNIVHNIIKNKSPRAMGLRISFMNSTLI